jgi:competence protein ComEC
MRPADYFFWILIGVLVGAWSASFVEFSVMFVAAFLFLAGFSLVYGVYEKRTRALLVGFMVLGISLGVVRADFVPNTVFTSRSFSGIAHSLGVLRISFEDSIRRALPEPESSLAVGILAGRNPSFPHALTDAMKRTSTLHLVAVSGYNITIVALAIMATLNLFTVSRRWSWILAALGIVLYTLFVGAPASAVRAAIMGTLVVVARHMGRVSSARNALALAAALMTLHNPRVLRFDLGFQLSFLATIGIIWLSPWIARVAALKFRRMAGNAETKPTIFTDLSGAQLMVAPWIFYKFGTVTVLGLGANILVMALTPFTMFWSFAAGTGGLLAPFLGQVFAAPAYVLLRYSLWVIETFSKIPLACLGC